MAACQHHLASNIDPVNTLCHAPKVSLFLSVAVFVTVDLRYKPDLHSGAEDHTKDRRHTWKDCRTKHVIKFVKSPFSRQ